MGTVLTSLAAKNVTRRQSFKTLGAGVAGTLFAPHYLKAKEPVTVRFADTTTTDNPEYAGETFFARRIGEETKGAYQVKLFPNSVLGSDIAMNEQVRNGTIELVKSGQGEPPIYDKRLSILSLPYLYTSRPKLFAALDGKLGQAYAEISAKYGLINLGFFDSGIRSVYNTKGPFKTPAELKALKLKIRVQPNQIMIATFNLLGAQSTPIAFAEVYNALQQGVVDAAENSITYYIGMKHIEVAKYYSKTQHFFGIDPVFVSAKWFNAQPSNIQKIFVDVAHETVEQERKLWLIREGQDYARAISMGSKINDVDTEAFQHAVKPIWEQNRNELGALYDIVQNTQ